MRAESTLTKTVAAVIAASAICASSASAQYQDLRSPDNRVATPAPPAETRTYTDLRSPDAVDAARDIVRVPAPPVTTVESDGFQWGDAAIGAGVIALLSAFVVSGAMLVRRRHRHDMGRGAPAVG